jgi:hypothetical protein
MLMLSTAKGQSGAAGRKRWRARPAAGWAVPALSCRSPGGRLPADPGQPRRAGNPLIVTPGPAGTSRTAGHGDSAYRRRGALPRPRARGRYRPSQVHQRLAPAPARAAIRAGSPRASSRRDKAACRRLHGPRASPVTASPAERSARCGRRPARRMTRRGSPDCPHATLNRPCVQISHPGVADQEHTDVQAAVQIGGTARPARAQRRSPIVSGNSWKCDTERSIHG